MLRIRYKKMQLEYVGGVAIVLQCRKVQGYANVVAGPCEILHRCCTIFQNNKNYTD